MYDVFVGESWIVFNSELHICTPNRYGPGEPLQWEHFKFYVMSYSGKSSDFRISPVFLWAWLFSSTLNSIMGSPKSVKVVPKETLWLGLLMSTNRFCFAFVNEKVNHTHFIERASYSGECFTDRIFIAPTCLCFHHSHFVQYEVTTWHYCQFVLDECHVRAKVFIKICCCCFFVTKHTKSESTVKKDILGNVSTTPIDYLLNTEGGANVSLL